MIDLYDEVTVLLQIPQEDTKIEDVVKKFKDPNKIVDTFVVHLYILTSEPPADTLLLSEFFYAKKNIILL